MIAELEFDAAKLDRMRKGLGRHARRFVAHQVFALELEQIGVFAFGFAPPFIEAGAVRDAFGNQAVVEGDDQLLVDQHVRSPRLVL